MNKTTMWLTLCSTLLRLYPAALPGKTRFARALLGSSLSARNVQIHARYDCTFRVPHFEEPIGFYLLINGVYEPTVARFLWSRLQAGSTFVDVGANIGVFTVLGARRVGTTGRVLALEPSPQVFPYIEHNIRLNGVSNTRALQCAAYDSSNLVSFYEAPIDHFGMGAMAPQFNVRPIEVQAWTLDHLLAGEGIQYVDILKVDVEGFEAAVFRGATQLLTCQAPPLIIFEFCDWAERRTQSGQVGDAQQILLDNGFSIWRLSDFVRGGSPLTDVLTSGFELLVASK